MFFSYFVFTAHEAAEIDDCLKDKREDY